MKPPLLLKLASLTYLRWLAVGALRPDVAGLRRHLSTLPHVFTCVPVIHGWAAFSL